MNNDASHDHLDGDTSQARVAGVGVDKTTPVGSNSGVTTLVNAPPPGAPAQELTPQQIEFYVRAGMHQDRSPGQLLVILHPGKIRKVPRQLFSALEKAGFDLTTVETDANRIHSVERIRNALVELRKDPRPLDLLVISGDGSLDHHVLVAAYWAFLPEFVTYRSGEISVHLGDEKHAALPADYRRELFSQTIETAHLRPTEDLIKQIWLLRAKLQPLIEKKKPATTLTEKSGLPASDPILQLSVISCLFPESVTLRADGFDLSGLVEASQEQTFQGLYPFLRSICTYPAGTAADNAVFAGVPGWGYSMLSGLLTRVPGMGVLRRAGEARVIKSFLQYFLHKSVVVPARISLVGLDGHWQRISSHAAGGPGAGRFFTADLTSKTKGLLGYLMRIPAAIIREGLFGSTIVRIRALLSNGQQKSFTEAQIAEGLYTNRTFIAGVGSIPTTDPTSFAGQSSFCVIEPIWYRIRKRGPLLNFNGIGAFVEAIVKGTLARALHMSGFGVGTLAGGGKFFFLKPEHQVALKEGEELHIEYLSMQRKSRVVPVQVSGDPFQAYRLDIRVAWGPIPLLAHKRSLLLASTRRSLSNLRLQQSYRLRGVYIGGLYYFRHLVGHEWSQDLIQRTGLAKPLPHLPRSLFQAQRLLLDNWQSTGAGEFVDTTASGLALWRRGRYAHNNDQSANLIVLRETNSTLLVRMVRVSRDGSGGVSESRTRYRLVGGAYIIFHSQVIHWLPDESPRILHEDHYFRNAEAFQQEAPTFFPVVARTPEEPSLLSGHEATEDDNDDQEDTL